jgi:hypothetical protein
VRVGVQGYVGHGVAPADEERLGFYVDGKHVKTVAQSPSYPMQLMLDLYEFPAGGPGDGTAPRSYPKEFVVDYVRGYRRVPR